MLNQLVFVGRISEIIKESDKKIEVEIKVPRSYKNIEGEYSSDIVTIMLYNTIAQNTIEYCNVGDLIGIKGRIERLDKNKPMEILAEKVTFLSNKKENK